MPQKECLMKIYDETLRSEKAQEIIRELLEQGWDDAIEYTSRITTLEGEEFDVVEQPEISPFENTGVWKVDLSESISCYGPGVSFGGVLENPYPYISSLMYLAKTDSSSDLIAKGEEVNHSIVTGNLDLAEREAAEILHDYPNRMTRTSRAFQTVLIPVKYDYDASE